MKRSEINGIINFLDRIPVSKIKDKTMRSRLTIVLFTLQKESRKIVSDIDELTAKIVDGKEDRMRRFGEVVQAFNAAKTAAEKEQLLSIIARNYPEEQVLNQQINDCVKIYLEEDASFAIEPFNMDDFMEAMESIGVEVSGRELRAIESILSE